MRPPICTYSCEFVLVQFYSVSNNTVGVMLLVFNVKAFYTFVLITFQG